MFYVLSMGPLIWLHARDMIHPAFECPLAIYVAPFHWAYLFGPDSIKSILEAYVDFWQ